MTKRLLKGITIADINWTAIGGICAVAVCLCAMATVFGEFILPEIKSRQKTSDDVDGLKIQVSSVLSDTKAHTSQMADMHMDIIEIKHALRIPAEYRDSLNTPTPATVTGVPSVTASQMSYIRNILNHNTRQENQARRTAVGLPPIPSKVGAALNAKELSGNINPTAAITDNSTAQ